MIDLIFERTPEIIFVRIERGNVTFSNSIQDQDKMYGSIDGLKFDYEGVIKEHPDLKDREDWNEEVIKRLKEKIKSFNNDLEISNYVIKELKSVGYIPLHRKRQGFRKEDLQ